MTAQDVCLHLLNIQCEMFSWSIVILCHLYCVLWQVLCSVHYQLCVFCAEIVCCRQHGASHYLVPEHSEVVIFRSL